MLVFLIHANFAVTTRPTERGVAGASAPGPGGPKGALRGPLNKKIKLV